MGCSVREMLSRIDSRELTEWIAYYELEPWGEERGDLRSGIVAATVANANRGKRTKPFKPIDFMPKFGTTKRKGEMSVEDMQAEAAAIIKAVSRRG